MTDMSARSFDRGGRETAGLRDYIRIARFDHMTKHIFIVPGIALAALLRGDAVSETGAGLLPSIGIGFASAVLVASANYVINEWLDRDFDKFHPEKAQRSAVQREMSRVIVVAEYIIFLALGLWLATMVNTTFFCAACLLALSGITYNVQPVRTKDRLYGDVLSEAVNNPIRLLMGWAMVDALSLPPVSLILAFWFGGAFLMNSKRLAEYRDIVRSDGIEVLHRYRRSFGAYSEARLSVANLIYALSCSFFMAIFLIKYRIEYILVFPCIVMLFAVYYALALAPDSVARRPEKLYRSKPVLISAGITALAAVLATFVDLPHIETLTEQQFILLDPARVITPE